MMVSGAQLNRGYRGVLIPRLYIHKPPQTLEMQSRFSFYCPAPELHPMLGEGVLTLASPLMPLTL